jgi:hypothetical protein
MEETQNNKTECGCGDDCGCKTNKKSTWRKYTLYGIIVAAIIIAFWKIYFCDSCCHKDVPPCCSKDSAAMVTDSGHCSHSGTHSCCAKKSE